MRIGVDVRELAGRATGVGRYLAGLLTAWADPRAGLAGRHQLVLYAPAPLPGALSARVAAVDPAVRVLPGGSGTWWEQVTLPAAAARDRLDRFFAPAYTAPIRLSCPVVQTIHDVSFFARPEWFNAREGIRRRLVTRLSARRAAMVLTDTEFSCGEIAKYLRLPPSRIRVIHPGAGVPSVFDRVPESRVVDAQRREREPLVLFVGSIFNRRRVPDLIAAFRLVVSDLPDARLEIVGENRTHPHQDIEALCADSGAGGRIRVRAYVEDAELADAFRRASAFAFLSEYEGFGLTPLEALASGVPAVLLDTPVAREVCGPAARYVAAGNIPAIAAALTALLGDPAARQAVLDEAPGVLERYSWPEAAGRTLAAIEAAGG